MLNKFVNMGINLTRLLFNYSKLSFHNNAFVL